MKRSVEVVDLHVLCPVHSTIFFNGDRMPQTGDQTGVAFDSTKDGDCVQRTKKVLLGQVASASTVIGHRFSYLVNILKALLALCVRQSYWLLLLMLGLQTQG